MGHELHLTVNHTINCAQIVASKHDDAFYARFLALTICPLMPCGAVA